MRIPAVSHDVAGHEATALRGPIARPRGASDGSDCRAGTTSESRGPAVAFSVRRVPATGVSAPRARLASAQRAIARSRRETRSESSLSARGLVCESQRRPMLWLTERKRTRGPIARSRGGFRGRRGLRQQKRIRPVGSAGEYWAKDLLLACCYQKVARPRRDKG